MKNRRLGGARRLLKKPDVRGLLRAIARLRLPSLSHKNRRRLSLFSRAPRTMGKNAHPPVGEPVAPPRKLGFVFGVLAFLAPLVAAGIAFAIPLIGVRAYEYVMESGHFRVRTVVVDDTVAPGGSQAGRSCPQAAAGPEDREAGRREPRRPHGARPIRCKATLEPHLSRAELLSIAGIDQGTHVLDADIDQMTRKLVDHPWIRWASIERELPDQLVVHVVEHRPSAYLAAGELYLVDELGVPFALAPADLALELPVISGIDPERVGDPDEALALSRDLAAGLNVLRLWDAHGTAARYPVSELRLLGGGRVTFVLESRAAGAATEIVLGRGPFREKFFRVEWVLEHLRSLGQTAEYILLDLGDDLPSGAVEIGGARVVVKSDLSPEAIDDAAASPAPPVPDADVPARAAPAPAVPLTPPGAPELDDEPSDSDAPAPLSGGRPARDDDEDDDEQE